MNKLYPTIWAYLMLLSCCFIACQPNPAAPEPTNSEKRNQPQALPDDFENAAVGHLDSMDILCAMSKAYQSNEWEELNHCRWALEKRILSQIPEYAKRNENLLSLQIDNGHWMALEHNTNDHSQAQYFQFRKYIPSAHFFLVTMHKSNACPTQWFVDAKNAQKLFFPGKIWKHPDQAIFITGAGDQKGCNEETHLIHFDKAGEIKFDRLKISGLLKNVKWANSAAIFQVLGSDGQMAYRKWVLP